MRHILPALLLFLVITTLFSPKSAALAQETDEARVNHIVFGPARWYKVRDLVVPDSTTDSMRAELRMPSIPLWRLYPWVGIEILPRNALYAALGLATDFKLSDSFTLTVSGGAGYFDDGIGAWKANTFPEAGMQIRTMLELSYEIIEDGPRIGFALSHLSNGGLKKPNPGMDAAGIHFHIPLRTGTP